MRASILFNPICASKPIEMWYYLVLNLYEKLGQRFNLSNCMRVNLHRCDIILF